MQRVYQAIDHSFSRFVALKMPMTSSAQKRFDRSAKVAAKVVHPNVAATLDYLPEQSEEYLVEELIEGSDLQKRFDADFYGLDAHLAAHVIHHVAKGIAAAHHAGVVHRDLKPSNIMVSADASLSVVKVTDFGIAKMAGQVIADEIDAMNRDTTTIAGSKTLVGAMPYMAPESLRQSPEAGMPADIWALGALCYWLVAGNPPFGTGLVAVGKILGNDKPSTPTSFGKLKKLALLEAKLWALINMCLERDASKRPTADGLVSKLEELCYSTHQRIEGVVTRVGIANNRQACFIQANDKPYFFNSGAAFLGFGNGVSVGQRVSFSPYQGHPHPRAGLVLLLK